MNVKDLALVHDIFSKQKFSRSPLPQLHKFSIY